MELGFMVVDFLLFWESLLCHPGNMHARDPLAATTGLGLRENRWKRSCFWKDVLLSCAGCGEVLSSYRSVTAASWRTVNSCSKAHQIQASLTFGCS